MEDGPLGYNHSPKPTVSDQIQSQVRAREALKAINPDLQGLGRKPAAFASPTLGSAPKADGNKSRKWIIPKTPEINTKQDEIRLEKLLDQRREAYAKEQEWTRRQIERLTTEKLKLTEEAQRLDEAKKRWNVPSPPLDPIRTPNSQATDQDDTPQYREMHERISNNLANMKLKFNKEKSEFEEGHISLQSVNKHSYETTQAVAYYMIRDIVVDVVNEAVDRCMDKGKIHKSRDLTVILVLEAERDLDSTQNLQSRERAMQLIAEEIYIETTSLMALEVVQEWLSIEDYIRSSTQGLVINSAEAVAVNDERGREEDDPAYDLITATYFHMCNERRRKRANLWKHTQTVHFLDPNSNDITSGVQSDQFDVTKLSMSKLVPIHLWPNKKISPSLEFYIRREKEYWKPERMTIQASTVKLSKRVGGVMTTQVSPTQRMVAFGTVRGDIFVYDLWYDSANPVRYIRNEGGSNDPIVQIAWSLDATRLITLNESGSVFMWSMHPGGWNTQDGNVLDFKRGDDEILPSQLTLLLALDPDADDFDFQEGPLAQSQVQTESHVPTFTAFHPSHTLIGSQNSIMIGFESGDIIKCNVEHQISGTSESFENTENVMYPTIASGGNFIGQDIPVELFRAHKYAIIHIGFVGNYGNMISVDQQGYIFVWKYSRRKLTHYGWFEPLRKYRFEMAEEVYESISNETPEIYFHDDFILERKKVKRKDRDRLRQEMEAERREAELDWRSLKMTQLWYREENRKAGAETWVYRPEEVDAKGSPFHILVRGMKTGMLLKHYSQMYKPVQNFASKLIESHATASGKELVFLPLFPPFPPKPPHLSFVILKTDGQIEVVDMRIDVILTKQEFDLCSKSDVCSFEISNTFDASGSSYIFLTLFADLMIFSINPGVLVLSTRKKDGQVPIPWAPKAPTKLWARSHVSLACTRNSTFILLSSEVQTTVNILQLTDRNTKETRMAVHRAFRYWNANHPRAAVEQTVRRQAWALDRDISGHVTLFARRLVLDMVDDAVQDVDGEFSEEEKKAFEEEKRWLAHLFYTGLQGLNAPVREDDDDDEQGSEKESDEEVEQEGEEDDQPQEDMNLPGEDMEDHPTV